MQREREREWKHVKPKQECERKKYHDMQVYYSLHHEKYNNMDHATVQLWHRATVASSRWMQLDWWDPLTSNG